MSRVYGLNVASLGLFCFGPKGPQRSIKMALAAGYHGIQALPIRGWSYDKMHLWEDCVISYEDAFNYGTVWQALQRLFGNKGSEDYPNPTFLDLALFGKRYSTYFPHALYVIHYVEKKWGWVEINPDLNLSIAGYSNHATRGVRYVWDTWHTRRPIRGLSTGQLNWRLLLKVLPIDSVGLIHVHPTQEEIEGYLAGHESELTEMLQMLGEKFPKVPAIVEYFPKLGLTPLGTIDYAREVLDVTKKWLD